MPISAATAVTLVEESSADNTVYLDDVSVVVIEADRDAVVLAAGSDDVLVVSAGEQGPRGPIGPASVVAGPQGPPGTDLNFTFNQGAPASTWDITHNLGKMPSVTVLDSGGSQVEGWYDFISVNRVVLHFSAAFSGTAYLN